jgi:hypothetical protein
VRRSQKETAAGHGKQLQARFRIVAIARPISRFLAVSTLLIQEINATMITAFEVILIASQFKDVCTKLIQPLQPQHLLRGAAMLSVHPT